MNLIILAMSTTFNFLSIVFLKMIPYTKMVHTNKTQPTHTTSLHLTLCYKGTTF
jgi:hypothetical protein